MKSSRLVVLVTILVAFTCYFCHQLFAYNGYSMSENLPSMLFIVGLVVCIASMPLLFWSRPHLREKGFFNGLLVIIFFSLSYMSYLLCLLLLRDLASGIAHLLGREIFDYSATEEKVILLLPVLFTGIGAWLAHRGPAIKKVRIPHAKLKGTRPYTIAQISDLHIGPSVGANSVKRVVDRTNALGADVIVLTGDIFDGNPQQNAQAIAVLKTLKAPDGIFFVPGNHEYFHRLETALETAESLGFRVLMNDFHGLRDGRILLGGVPDRMAPYFGKLAEDAPGLIRRMKSAGTAAMFVLLEHQPHNADRNAKLGFDLQLSGHTHDGQFFPWTWVVRMIQKYAHGHFEIGSMHLYVNSGTMYWGPPNRFGPSSEITYLELQSD